MPFGGYAKIYYTYSRGTMIDEAIRNHQIVLKVISYLENHYAEPITLDDIAREVDLTKGYYLSFI